MSATMAIIRLTNGNDVPVKLSVPDAIAAVHVVSGTDGFVELPTEDGPIHVRPAAIIAVLEDAGSRKAGFRIAADG
jgi:hypothetical protein